jgi:hypothetical protein
MQLRGHTYHDLNEPLEITDRDQLEEEITCLHGIIAAHLNKKGITSLEINSVNALEVTSFFPPQGAFLLGRLCTLVQLHSELYSDDRLLPWIKNPENN